MGGDAAFQPYGKTEMDERRRQERMTTARKEALAMLEKPEKQWLTEILSLYLDCKDFLSVRPRDLTPKTRAAFRAIREGSGGRLGAPPLL